MQVIFVVLVLIEFLLSFLILGEHFEKDIKVIKFINKIKWPAGLICTLILCIISIIGCIAIPNQSTLFLVIYVAFYFLLKEIYTKFFIERRNEKFIIELESRIETSTKFENVFELISSAKEKKHFLGTWIQSFASSDGGKGISILFDKVRYNYILKNKQDEVCLDYVIKQIFDSVNKINNADDLLKIDLYLIHDKIVKDYAYDFIPHGNKKISNRVLNIYGINLFNIIFGYGYVGGHSIVNLIYLWEELSLIMKTIHFIVAVLGSLLFLLGVIAFIAILTNRKEET